MNVQNQNRDAEMAQLAGEFLKRVDLKGGEVPAFMAVQQWLMSRAQMGLPPQPADNPVPHPEAEAEAVESDKTKRR